MIPCMAEASPPSCPQVQEDQVHCLQIVRGLLPWRDQLRSGFGTSHGNASLEVVDVLVVMLAGFFNPMVRSQRLLEALSSQAWMRERTGLKRIPRSTLSDALKRFDPEQLRPLIERLAARVPSLRHHDPDLAEVTRQVIAADGSQITLLGEVAWAIFHPGPGTSGGGSGTSGGGGWSQARLNIQLDIDSMAPVDGDVSGAEEPSEPEAFIRRLRPGVIYLADRNFVHFRFLNAVLGKGSNFVVRLKKNNLFDVGREAPLDERDRARGVRSDQRGRLPGPVSAGNADARSCTSRPPAQELRRVAVWDEADQKEVVLLTDLLDPPAHVVAALYRNRWQVELFFKWLKCTAAMEHAVSRSPRGLTMQFYVAMIGTLLLHLSTGRRVSKYALFWLGSVAAGRATWEEMQKGLERIEREKELERARLARRRLAKKIQA
ncbi:MAG: IS4 family transposase [Planctomycetota bacterium]|nr:IS4 family transposase [Planctomycetota bacterium]